MTANVETRAVRQGMDLIPGIKNVIAVASGKGGVGKSTSAVNLALALKEGGASVGILDADIYGPSLPRMMGVHGRPKGADDEDAKKIEPMMAHGVKCMSMGFFMDEDHPMIWRGPMVAMAVEQLINDVDWGELDYLVVDLPPGTGDAQLTLTQKVPLTGAVIISTPQDVALADVKKGMNMFKKVDVPVLGIVENMSYYLCPDCGHRAHIFSHGGAKVQAEQFGIPFLGEVPLVEDIREDADAGKPIVVARPDSEQAKKYGEIAQNVIAEMGKLKVDSTHKFPKIVVQ